MEIRHHLYPLLQLSFEGKASFLKTEASSRFWFQELLSSHEFKMERHISTIQNIGLQGKKKQPSKHTKKPIPVRNKITIKNPNPPGRCTHILGTSFHPTWTCSEHILLQALGMEPIQQTQMLQIPVEAYTLSSWKQQILLVRCRDRTIKVFKYHV